MDESFTWQKLLCKIRKSNFRHCQARLPAAVREGSPRTSPELSRRTDWRERQKSSLRHCNRGTKWKVIKKAKLQFVKNAIKALIVILQIANILANLYIMHVIQLIPFPSLSAMRTSLGQRDWEFHRLVSCRYHSWYSYEQLLYIGLRHWCTEKTKHLYIIETFFVSFIEIEK